MSTAKHTPEPWARSRRYPEAIYSSDDTGSIVAKCDHFTFTPRPEQERLANADRIVACVNACQGIPTSVLEKLAAISPRFLRDRLAEASDRYRLGLEGVSP
jgi:hypothetical protein